MEEIKCNKLLEVKKKDRIISFFKENYKMKLLVVYLIFNLIYLTFGSFVFTTQKFFPEFNYQQFSLGHRNMLVLNVIVFFIICICKKYKKNWSHLILEAVVVMRSNCNNVCIR